MIGALSKQFELLGFIEAYQTRTGGVSPSFREIIKALGWKSIREIRPLLDDLCANGYIDFLPNRARAIEVLRSVIAPRLNGEPLRIVHVHAQPSTQEASRNNG